MHTEIECGSSQYIAGAADDGRRFLIIGRGADNLTYNKRLRKVTYRGEGKIKAVIAIVVSDLRGSFLRPKAPSGSGANETELVGLIEAVSMHHDASTS